MRFSTGIIASGLLVIAGAAGAQTTYSNSYPGNQQPPPPPSQDSRYYSGDRDNRNDNNDRGRYGRGEAVTCRSSRSRYTRCAVPWRNAQLVQQTSTSACVRGSTWGFEHGSIWVDRGCAGRFAAVGGGGGWQPPPNWNQRFTVSCGSPQHRYAFCQVDVGSRGRVYLQQQTSNASCVEGQTWGWNRAGVWVDRGCGANFVVDRRF